MTVAPETLLLYPQWGNGDGSGTTTVAFPISFPHSCLQVAACFTGGGTYENSGLDGNGSLTKGNFKVWFRYSGSYRYIALGK